MLPNPIVPGLGVAYAHDSSAVAANVCVNRKSTLVVIVPLITIFGTFATTGYCVGAGMGTPPAPPTPTPPTCARAGVRRRARRVRSVVRVVKGEDVCRSILLRCLGV